jgi:hypothetical protein
VEVPEGAIGGWESAAIPLVAVTASLLAATTSTGDRRMIPVWRASARAG